MTEEPGPPPPPKGSKAKVEQSDGSIRIHFPPLGVLRYPGALIFLIFGALTGMSGISLAVVVYNY